MKERSDDSPDLFVANGDLCKARKITDTNPFQKDFLWGRSELVNFKNKNGVPLQGALTYPANYKPGQKYPIIVYWNSGQSNTWIFSQSQGRMDKPFWRDVDNYVRNSPIHGLDNLNTPLLMAFGDKDGAVDWGQGVQMYNAARWAGKDDLVMLVYPGENHSLGKEENMVDYHYRVLEWFSHYLKEKEAPRWITEGQSYLDRKEE